MFALVLMGTVALVYYISFRRSRKRLYELAARIPGPFDYPLVGSVLVALGRGPTEFVAYLMELMHDLPSPMRAWLGPYLMVMIDQPAMVQDILNSPNCIQRPFMYDFFRLKKGLFGAAADRWKLHRKLLNTSFATGVLRSFVPIFNAKADKFTRDLQDKVSPECFDVHNLLTRYTLISISETMMDVNLSDERVEVLDEYSSNGVQMFTACFERAYKAWLHPEVLFRLTPAYNEERKRMAKFKQMSRRIMDVHQAKRRQVAADRTNSETQSNVSDIPKGKIFIERLAEISHELGLDIDEDGFQQHIDTLMFAGNDTSAQALSNTLLAMGMFPELQDKMYQEVMEVSPGGSISYEDLSRLTYMDRFLKETLRLLPVTGIIGRLVTKDVQAQNFTIPAGAIVMIPFVKMHHNKNIWGSNADEFNPDNFLPERCAQRHPYAFIPFSQGPRNCIGMKYGWISMKILLCHVVRRYRIATDIKLSDIKLSLSLVMKLNTKHMIRLESRTNGEP